MNEVQGQGKSQDQGQGESKDEAQGNSHSSRKGWHEDLGQDENSNQIQCHREVGIKV